MSGLLATLDLGARALQAQRQGLDVAGQNLANVNTPGYARQRLLLQSTTSVSTALGPQGTGVTATAIQQMRSSLLDRQIQSETSVGGFWNSQQQVLQQAQASLGELLDNQTTTTGTGATDGASSGSSLGSALNGLFTSFQSLTVTSASASDRELVISNAQSLTAKLRQTDQRLGQLTDSLNESLDSDLQQANDLLGAVAGLNRQIRQAEAGGGTANDLRDLRQQKLESLATLVNVETATDPDGQLNVSVSGTLLVSGSQVMDSLETYDSGNGRLLVRTATAGTELALTGGSLQGTIDVRDGALTSLRHDLNALASNLITRVNQVHRGGFSATGTTGADFFTGTTAADIQVNPDLVANPSLIQSSGVVAAAGNTQVALALARLADEPQTALGQQTFSQSYNRTVAGLGQSLATANTQVADQQVVEDLLQKQRDSVSAVSLDEEMTDLVKYQKAFEASARLLSMVNELLGQVVNLGR